MRKPVCLVLTSLVALWGCGSDDSSTGADATPGDDGPTPDSGGTDGPGADTADTGPIVTHPTNILNNGGFEYAMACYGEYVQPDGNGDYGFYLSSDAHSGKYSLEMRCIGAQCAQTSNQRAFVITQAFHMPANQGYKLTVWTKCASGADAFWYTESSSKQYYSVPLSCTGAWAQNEIHFTSPATDKEGTFYYFNHSASSLFIDDAVLTYEDGTVPVHTVSHPGVRNVQVSGTSMKVDGKPYLALGFFDVPFDELANVAAIKGANAVTSLGSAALSDCFNTDRAPYADHAYDLGLDIIPDLTTTSRLAEPAVFPDVMDRFAPHLANVGFYMADEPDQAFYKYSLIDPTVMAAERTSAHTRSALPLLADLQHAHYDPPAVDQPFASSMDIYGSEPYQEDCSGITQTFKVFGTMTPRPVWLFDDNHTDVTTVVPKAYYGVIQGSYGLFYFDWPSLDMANRTADAQAIGELASLRDVIFATDATSSVTAPAGVAFIGRTSGGKTYVLAVNATTSPVTGSLTATGLGNGTVTVMFESRTIAASGGSFTDTFAATSRHVYSF